jgi:methylglyoxal synthase
VLYNIPTASNRSTADFMISSPLMQDDYDRTLPDYEKRLEDAQEDD